MVDYHLHTVRCCHAQGTMEEYLAEAKRKGISEIGFADHFPLALLDFEPRSPVTMQPEELPEYVKQVRALQAIADPVQVRLGIEIDYIPGKTALLPALLEVYRFDYVIGSVHFIGEWDFTHPDQCDQYKNCDLMTLNSEYYKLIREACSSGCFDIIGHIDVVEKFGYRPDVSLEPHWEKTAAVLAETGTAIEINTAGKDAPVGRFYPGQRLLEICRAAGVAVTMGSDAHAPDQVGRYFPEAIKALKEAGYRELTTYQQRRKKVIPI